MSKILLASFVLLSLYQTSEALSLGGLEPINWTSEDYAKGYKLVGDMVFTAPKSRAWGLEKSRTWANGRVPYKMSSSFSATAQANIKRTMEIISTKVDNCVQFVEKTASDPNYVDILPNDESGCYSYVGDIKSGAQFLKLDYLCQDDKAVIAHELMHALGFHHEQNRADRDNFVKIDFNLLTQQQDQYIKQTGQAYTTPYDYQSLMHYPANDGMTAINPVGSAIPGAWGRPDTEVPSKYDIQGIQSMYCTKPNPSCDGGFNGADCSNQYFKCPAAGTFADPLFCYKIIFCRENDNGVGFTSKLKDPNTVTECGIITDNTGKKTELNFWQGKCTWPTLFTNPNKCSQRA